MNWRDIVSHITTHTLYYQQQKMRTFSVTYQRPQTIFNNQTEKKKAECLLTRKYPPLLEGGAVQSLDFSGSLFPLYCSINTLKIEYAMCFQMRQKTKQSNTILKNCISNNDIQKNWKNNQCYVCKQTKIHSKTIQYKISAVFFKCAKTVQHKRIIHQTMR